MLHVHEGEFERLAVIVYGLWARFASVNDGEEEQLNAMLIGEVGQKNVSYSEKPFSLYIESRLLFDLTNQAILDRLLKPNATARKPVIIVFGIQSVPLGFRRSCRK